MSEGLRLHCVTAGYGASVVLEDVSVAVPAGESLAVLGRNGAGKSTLLGAVMGLVRQHRGSISWLGRDLASWSTHERARAGIGWVPQERLVFPSLTVEEHLSSVMRRGYWDSARLFDTFPSLARRRHHRGRQLSGGEQQMLAIARALATNPSLLLLDEPLEGLAPLIVRELVDVIRGLVNTGVSMVLVEQHARHALKMTRHAIVIERGRVAHSSPSQLLLRSPAVLESLLGVGVAA